MSRLLMRLRWPWILFLSLSLLVAVGSTFIAEVNLPPEEDGPTAIPMLRTPEPEAVAPGPIPVSPVSLKDVTFRVSFRWLGTAPPAAELERELKAVAAEQLAGFAVQPRPARSWVRKLRRAPLVPAPGLEFALVKMPMTTDLSPYEVATSENTNRLASGQKPSGTQTVYLTPDLFIVDFHIRADELRRRLRSVDAFIIAFAEKTRARIKSDERPRHASPEELRQRRLNRWVNDIPFAPAYVALVEYSRRGVRTPATENAKVLGLPELWVAVPEGSASPRVRHLLIGAILQRMVENPVPDAPGIIDLNVRALRHPDMEQWVTGALPPGASGRIRFRVRELPALGGRLLLFRPEREPGQAYCEFAGCDATASFGE